MKTIAPAAMAAIEAGEAIVTGAVEIDPVVTTSALFGYDAEFDYRIIDEVIDADPVSGVVPPSDGFDSTGTAPFGHAGGASLTPAYPIVTAWLPQTSLWLLKSITTGAGTLTLSGHVENGAVFFLDDELIGSVNADNSQSSASSGIAYAIETTVTAGEHTLKILVLDEPEHLSGDNTYFYCQASTTIGGDGTPIRLWGGYGPITIDGGEYQGVGARGLAQQNAGAVGGVAQGLTLSLSGVEAAALDLLDGEEIKRASVVLYRLIFASDGKTLLDAHVFDRGRVDTVGTEEAIGGTATINVAVESAARGLGRAGGRMRADSDQRLIDADDGYFKNTAYAAQKMLYWGGKRPYKAG